MQNLLAPSKGSGALYSHLYLAFEYTNCETHNTYNRKNSYCISKENLRPSLKKKLLHFQGKKITAFNLQIHTGKYRYIRTGKQNRQYLHVYMYILSTSKCITLYNQNIQIFWKRNKYILNFEHSLDRNKNPIGYVQTDIRKKIYFKN